MPRTSAKPNEDTSALEDELASVDEALAQNGLVENTDDADPLLNNVTGEDDDDYDGDEDEVEEDEDDKPAKKSKGKPGPRAKAGHKARPALHVYKTLQGETFGDVSEKFGVTHADLLKVNPHINPHFVLVDTELRIPVK